MSFMDKVFKKKDDEYDNPFGSSSANNSPFSEHPDPLIPTGDPLTPQLNPSVGAPGIPPPMFDINNPDINSQTGTPRPREKEYDPSPTSPMIGGAGAGVQERDVQLILAKLDAIKSELDSIHQRVRKIELIADEDQQAAAKPQNPNYGRW